MPHFRQQIRDDLVAALDGATAAGARVYKGTPPQNLEQEKLPAIYISTPQTTVDPVSMRALGGTVTYHRTTDVEIAMVVRGASGSTVEDQLDDLCVVVEPLAMANRPASLKAFDLVSEDRSVDNETGEQIFAEHVLTYAAEYATPDNSPSYY